MLRMGQVVSQGRFSWVRGMLTVLSSRNPQAEAVVNAWVHMDVRATCVIWRASRRAQLQHTSSCVGSDLRL